MLMRIAPGGPFDGERALDPATRSALASRYGPDKPLGEQFLSYIGGLLRGHFGPSMVYRAFSVNSLVAHGLHVSLTFGALALALALSICIPLGFWAAWRRPGVADRSVLLLPAPP